MLVIPQGSQRIDRSFSEQQQAPLAGKCRWTVVWHPRTFRFVSCFLRQQGFVIWVVRTVGPPCIVDIVTVCAAACQLLRDEPSGHYRYLHTAICSEQSISLEIGNVIGDALQY